MNCWRACTGGAHARGPAGMYNAMINDDIARQRHGCQTPPHKRVTDHDHEQMSLS